MVASRPGPLGSTQVRHQSGRLSHGHYRGTVTRCAWLQWLMGRSRLGDKDSRTLRSSWLLGYLVRAVCGSEFCRGDLANEQDDRCMSLLRSICCLFGGRCAGEEPKPTTETMRGEAPSDLVKGSWARKSQRRPTSTHGGGRNQHPKARSALECWTLVQRVASWTPSLRVPSEVRRGALVESR